MFNTDLVPDNDYLLLTPGPLSTSKGVRAALLQDWCTWDDDYNSLTQEVCRRLVDLGGSDEHSAVLMQGSGTFAVESLIGSLLAADDKPLIAANGAYGRRIAQIAQYLNIPHTLLDFGDVNVLDPLQVAAALDADPDITHLVFVHCETTTGALNPLEELVRVGKERGKYVFVDAMSSFGGLPISLAETGIDALVSSANKCIQGVPGFGFALVRESLLKTCGGRARSLSMDLVAQRGQMESGNGKWRFTSPTHTVHAFHQALIELADEGGIEARYARFSENQRRLVDGCAELGLLTVMEKRWQSPVITAFAYPDSGFDFKKLYAGLKAAGFVIYPGKVSELDTFRIGTIGDVYPEDIDRLVDTMKRLLIGE